MSIRTQDHHFWSCVWELPYSFAGAGIWTQGVEGGRREVSQTYWLLSAPPPTSFPQLCNPTFWVCVWKGGRNTEGNEQSQLSKKKLNISTIRSVCCVMVVEWGWATHTDTPPTSYVQVWSPNFGCACIFGGSTITNNRKLGPLKVGASWELRTLEFR